jgi:hypothetical protein
MVDERNSKVCQELCGNHPCKNKCMNGNTNCCFECRLVNGTKIGCGIMLNSYHTGNDKYFKFLMLYKK